MKSVCHDESPVLAVIAHMDVIEGKCNVERIVFTESPPHSAVAADGQGSVARQAGDFGLLFIKQTGIGICGSGVAFCPDIVV